VGASERQYWVRNEQGRTWGPYDLASLERLRGVISEQWDVALDGKKFEKLPKFPELIALAQAPRRAAPPPLSPKEPERDGRDLREAARRALRANIDSRTPRAGGSGNPEPTTPPSAPASPATEPAPAPPTEASPESRRSTGSSGLHAAPKVGTPTIGTPTSGTRISSALSSVTGVPDEGDLEELPPLRLYALAALSSASGWLQLESPAGTMLQISFRRGSPEHLESDDPELSLLAFLRKQGTVTAPQAAEAAAHTEKAGVDLVTALFQLQLIPPADAHRLLKEQMLALLDRALMMWRGRFSFEAEAPPPPGAFPLGQRWMLLAESIRRLDAKPLRARMGARLQFPVVRSGGLALGRVEELALTAHEARLYAAIDGVRTGEQLLSDSQDPATTLRLLYLLGELGHLSFLGAPATTADATRTARGAAAHARAVALPPPTPPAPEPSTTEPPLLVEIPDAPVMGRRASSGASNPVIARPPVAALPPRAPPNPTVATQRTTPSGSFPPAPRAAAPKSAPLAKPAPRTAAGPISLPPQLPPASFVSGPAGETSQQMFSRLAPVLARIEPADHFTALGIDRKATATDVKKTFFLLARELHPDTVQDGHAELRELKQRLFARVNEAAQVLQDEKRRKEHEDELDGKGSVDVARIFAAEEAFQRGEIMIKARKIAEGLALVEEAIELNQDEGEFYAWRGWARFVLSKDRKTQHPQSAADCRKALAMIEKCLPAWLFLGNMAKAMGDAQEAERNFRKVLELDPKHVDAQRELRTMGKKIEPK
jgi:hypothetical protein